MGLFDQDYNDTTWQNMPVRLRKAIHFAWLKCLIAPVRYVQNLFKAFRSNNVYVLSHNSQVCYMEAALNDTFDSTARRIFINDGPVKTPLFLYKQVESKPVYIDLVSEIGTGIISPPDPVPLYTTGETTVLTVSFIVNVPASLTFDIERMKALIDLYRLPSKGYKIVTF